MVTLETHNLDLFKSIIKNTSPSRGDGLQNTVSIIYDGISLIKADIEVKAYPFDNGEYTYPVLVKMVKFYGHVWNPIIKSHEFILKKVWSDFYEWDYGDNIDILKGIFPDLAYEYEKTTFNWDEFVQSIDSWIDEEEAVALPF